jgi:hypothetical protein
MNSKRHWGLGFKYFPEYEIERFEYEGGYCSPFVPEELKMEEVTVIDLLGAKDAEKQKRNEKHQESETIREVEE